jgi:hypothetical protein
MGFWVQIATLSVWGDQSVLGVTCRGSSTSVSQQINLRDQFLTAYRTPLVAARKQAKTDAATMFSRQNFITIVRHDSKTNDTYTTIGTRRTYIV